VNILAAGPIAAVVLRTVKRRALSGLIILGQVWFLYDFMFAMSVRAIFSEPAVSLLLPYFAQLSLPVRAELNLGRLVERRCLHLTLLVLSAACFIFERAVFM